MFYYREGFSFLAWRNQFVFKQRQLQRHSSKQLLLTMAVSARMPERLYWATYLQNTIKNEMMLYCAIHFHIKLIIAGLLSCDFSDFYERQFTAFSDKSSSHAPNLWYRLCNEKTLFCLFVLCWLSSSFY